MTKKEFKEAMLRGLGRCILAVKAEPEKYRDMVLWACGRIISYDTQSEGTRAWYVHTMACCYPDREPFIRAAARALEKYRPNGSWELLHLSELLMYFARDGHDAARRAVEEKYRTLLEKLHRRKRRPDGVFHELSDLEQLALVLTEDRASFLRIAGDLGRLYREKEYMLDGDFGWFFASEGARYRKSMERAALKDENIACFLAREQAAIDTREACRKQRQTAPPETYTGVRLSRWLAKQADAETVARYAAAYRQENGPGKRAAALKAFCLCPYPDDPEPIITDARSDCEELENAAWRALENLRHPAVRHFAHANVAAGVRTPENFALLVTNYVPQDAPLLEELLGVLIAAGDWDGVHGAGLDIYRAFYRSSGIPHPKHLLPLLYEYNPCSFCRESALHYMSRHQMLTRPLLEECLWDSNDDIRRFAAKKLKA